MLQFGSNERGRTRFAWDLIGAQLGSRRILFCWSGIRRQNRPLKGLTIVAGQFRVEMPCTRKLSMRFEGCLLNLNVFNHFVFILYTLASIWQNTASNASTKLSQGIRPRSRQRCTYLFSHFIIAVVSQSQNNKRAGSG
jgi:hypothetical protein